MLTTDLALRFDPVYEQISRRFHENPDEFADAFARAWFKLTHRDMGPVVALPRSRGPGRGADLAGPGPGRRPRPRRRRRDRRAEGRDPRLRPLGRAAGLDRVGLGLDLPRQRQARRRQRRAHPARAAERLGRQRPGRARHGARCPRGIQTDFNARTAATQVSLADLIVLGGAAAVEKAAKDAGVEVDVPFTPGRTDASQEQTDVESFAVLEPRADGFRNYRRQGTTQPAEYLLVDKANLLTLTAPEMTVLVGGLRVLGANAGGSTAGVLTDRAGHADERLLRQPARHGHRVGGHVRGRGHLRGPRPRDRRASSGPAAVSTSSSARTRSCVRWPRSTRSDDAEQKFVARLRRARGTKVMDLDRFDVA